VDTLGWAYAYNLPPRLSAPVLVMTNPRRPDMPLRNFAIEGAFLHADVNPVYAVFMNMMDPNLWSPQFRAAVTVALASALAVPVTHDLNLKIELAREAFGPYEMDGRGGLVGQAIAAEVNGNVMKAPIAVSSPLIDARDE
jgi:hypothetical protein